MEMFSLGKIKQMLNKDIVSHIKDSDTIGKFSLVRHQQLNPNFSYCIRDSKEGGEGKTRILVNKFHFKIWYKHTMLFNTATWLPRGDM
jgi:hypothetical protein